MDTLQIRPLTARSVVLSTLLGVHPPRLAARHLVRVGDLFGIAEGTIRVALSRMVTSGDLVQTDGAYAETKDFLGGLYLLEAEELGAAVALARHIPAAFDGGRVEVRALMPM